MDMCEYIKAATSQIRSRRARDMVARELEAHMEDQAAYYREQGMSEEEAGKEAVRQMGDPVEVGISMDQIHRPQTDWKMIIMLVLLCVLGLCLQIALNREVAEAQLLEEGVSVSLGLFSGISRAFVITLAAAVVLGVLTCVMDYTIVLRYAPWFICFILFMLWVQGWVIWPNSSNRMAFPVKWYYLLVPLYASLLYRYRGRGRRGFVGGILLLVLLQVIMSAQGTWMVTSLAGLRFSFVLAVMLSVAVLCGWYGEQRRGKLVCLWGGALLAFGLAAQWMLLRGGFRAERIRAILHPYDYAGSGGYYVVTIRGWLGRCKLWGNPEAAAQFAQGYIGVFLTDGSFNVDGGNLLYLFLRYGIVPGVIVCLIFLGSIGYFLYRCLRQKNQLGQMTGAGCCIVFLVEFAGALMSNLGVLICNGAIPFLSYGGQEIEVWAILAGLVFSIIRYQNLLPAEHKDAGRKYRYRLRIEKIAL